MRPDQTSPTRRSHLLAAGGYLLLTLVLLAPVLADFATAIPGGEVAAIDGWQHVWHVWWTHEALRSGLNPFFTPLLFYPSGVDLGVHPLNVSNGLLAFPITALAGPIAGYNTAVILAFTLAGLGAYLLALEVGARPLAAFLAGIVFAFGPYHLTKLWDGQLELIALQWLPFYALALLRAAPRLGRQANERFNTPSPSTLLAPVLAGLLLALIGYTSLYYLLFAAVYSLVFVLLWTPFRAGWRAVLHWLFRAALIALSALLWLTPLLGSILASAELVGQTERVNPLLIARSANLLDLFLPSYLHPLWGPAVASLGPRWHPGIAAWNAALGYTALALAAIAVVRARPAAWRWLVLALAGALLALGPELRIGDWQTGMALPYRALLSLPGFSIGQRPGHFVLVMVLALVPLVALGLEYVLRHLNRQRRPLLLGLIGGLLLLEYAVPPPPLQRPLITPAAVALAEGSGGLFVIPEQKGQIRSLQDQLVHGRPIAGGFLARVGEHPVIDQIPLLHELWRVEPLSNRMILPDGVDQAMLLRAYGFSEVVAEWEFMNAERAARARELIATVLPDVAPTFSSDNAAVYPIPAGPVQPFAFFDSGWYRVETNGERSWRWMSGAATVTLVNPTNRVQPITLNLAGESYRIERRLELTLNEHPLGTWDVPAPPARTAMHIRLWLPPGRHSLHLAAASESVAPHGPISIAFTQVAIR